MASRAGNWMIAVGVIGALLGICLLPAAMGEHPDATLLALGACALSLGSITASLGFYLKARNLEAKAGPGAEPKSAPRRARGGCDVCGDTPVVNCKVHRVHLCADCLGQHYDFRSCAYVPSTRRQGGRTGKSMVAKARA